MKLESNIYKDDPDARPNGFADHAASVARAPGRNFLAAVDQVIKVVGSFGEDLCVALLKGRSVSDDDEFSTFADVFVDGPDLAVEAKMCNARHDCRSTEDKIARLHREVEEGGFVINVRYGLYAVIFYRGIHGAGRGRGGKSKLLSRKISKEGKRAILAEELQRIYFIDVKLMHHLATSDNFMRLHKAGGKANVCPERKLSTSRFSNRVLCLNRTFLKEFSVPKKELSEGHKKALDKAMGDSNWTITSKCLSLNFSSSDGSKMSRTLPVHTIGSKRTVRQLNSLLGPKGSAKEMSLSSNDEGKWIRL